MMYRRSECVMIVLLVAISVGGIALFRHHTNALKVCDNRLLTAQAELVLERQQAFVHRAAYSAKKVTR
jgi:hypothetical protein